MKRLPITKTKKEKFLTRLEFMRKNKICIRCNKVDNIGGYCPRCMRCWDCMTMKCKCKEVKEKP